MKRMKTPNLMAAHMHLNLGIYFSQIEDIGPFRVGLSSIITDYYWNYAYMRDGSSPTQKQLNDLTEIFRKAGRLPAFWQNAEVAPPEGWASQSEEAWMWFDASDRAELGKPELSSFAVSDFAVPTEDMLAVFNDAYSSAGDPSDVGYFSLPAEYGVAYINSRPSDDVKIRHFGAWLGDICVSVATGLVWADVGGLYSVATRHGYRQRGLGSYLSRVATSWMFTEGASGVMLQTTKDSTVEQLYSSLGYKRTHLGVLLSPADQ